MSDTDKQDTRPENQAMQHRCVDMPNDAPEGHYWAWVNSPKSVPKQFRQCMICDRIDATEELTKLISTAVREARLEEMQERPDSIKFDYDHDRIAQLKEEGTVEPAPVKLFNGVPKTSMQGSDMTLIEAYRKGYNDNARDCYCDSKKAIESIIPHKHLMDDGKSHSIRPDIAQLKEEE